MARVFPPSPALLALGAVLVAGGSPLAAQEGIRGFPDAQVAAQRAREAEGRAVPNRDTLAAHMERLTRGPHLVGTPASRAVAEALLARWRSFGVAAQIETFPARIPLPVSQVVELVSPERHAATLQEPGLPEDPATMAPGYIPSFAGFAADGDVTAEVVYVNYGFQEDYRLLDSLGISVRGKIVLARDGGVSAPRWRLAAERGAVGVLVYHDPKDEGFYTGEAYPKGARRPEFAIRTGSHAGSDELTDLMGGPGAPGNAGGLPTIPVMVIAGQDALPMLRHLTGTLAPEAWRGAYPVTYRLGGGGPARVRMALRSDWAVRTLYNVVATIPGARSEAQWVLVGTHHDAIGGPGADDPISSLVAIDEALRTLAQLRARGWRPARTLKFLAWDGEELGILGSLAWMDRHADALRRSAIVYLNGDNVQAGWFRAQGPPSLQPFVQELLRDLPDPERGVSVLQAWQQGPGIMNPGGSVTTVAGAGARPFALAPMGLNTDAAPFGLKLGIPAMHMAYSGRTGPLGARHTRYETYQYYSRFLDPGFGTVALLSRTFTMAALRLADAPLLPFAFTGVAPLWRRQLEDIDKVARATPRVGALPLAPLWEALDTLAQTAARYEAAAAPLARLSPDDAARRWNALAPVNARLYQAEQALLDPDTTRGPRYNRHLVMGTTGLYSRTGVNPFPHLTRAVVERPDAAVARDAIERLVAAVRRYAAQVDAAATALAAALR
jgi:N-acetylated-alpha-linked acidic dipeptidase